MAELNVSRKTIGQLFGEIKKDILIIPEYQTPYKRDREKCDILGNAIINFHNENEDNSNQYFLGTIVTCKTDDGFEVIDGQQRITSLFLLLRAFYTKLEAMDKQDDREVIGLKSQIAPCIWDVNRKSKIVEDYSKIHIMSKVATEKDNDVFHSILKDGKSSNEKSLYAINYNYFLTKCNEFAKNEPLEWLNLCLTILDSCIVFPIECDSLDSALTIFSTLNDRGMPLSDSDIFKAQIYKDQKNDDAKQEFTTKWKELSEHVDEAGISLNDIFRYYSHVIRARNMDRSKEIGLRRFYSNEKFKNLKEPELIEKLISLAKFWKIINKDETYYLIGNSPYLNDDSRKLLQLLYCYPNEYWKYITSVYFFFCKNNNVNIQSSLPEFWRKISTFLYVKFIYSPTVNAIKDAIYSYSIDVYHKHALNFEVAKNEDFRQRLSAHNSSRITKGLLFMYAYTNPAQALITFNPQIEHIFPQKWQNTNYNGWNKEDADEYLEKLGNKVLIEKRINIQANNSYFGKKRDIYKDSKIVELQILAKNQNSDWLKDDISARENEILEALTNYIFEKK